MHEHKGICPMSALFRDVAAVYFRGCVSLCGKWSHAKGGIGTASFSAGPTFVKLATHTLAHNVRMAVVSAGAHGYVSHVLLSGT
jgi:hypothetical protein